MAQLILATASKYKIGQFQQLGLHFESLAANINEQPLAGECAIHQAQRLALAKAKHIGQHYPSALVIGCDQSADLNGKALSKPGSIELARHQLQQSSGQELQFHSAVALYNQSQQLELTGLCTTSVKFRTLSNEEIEAYIKKEDALDCVGAFKIEALGINLFESVCSNDPSALIGLPLIECAKLLRKAGINPLLS